MDVGWRCLNCKGINSMNLAWCGGCGAGPMKPVEYDRERLITTLIYHQRSDIKGCACGWGELGKSWAEHVVNMYEVGYGQPCKHCSHPIIPADTSTGWIHGPEDPPIWANWQGVRCPGRLTGAEPA